MNFSVCMFQVTESEARAETVGIKNNRSRETCVLVPCNQSEGTRLQGK